MMIKISLFLSLPAIVSRAYRTCYYPDGSTAAGDIPCFSENSDSPCCDYNSICLSNGYCMNIAQPFVLSRQSCTDREWGSESGCKDVCSSVTSARSRGCSLPLFSFDGETALYCANSIVRNSSGVACANGEPFPLENANVITNRGLFANASCALDTVSPTTVNITPSSTISPSSDATTTNIINIAGDKEDTKKIIGIATSLGVLFVLVMAGALFALFKRRRRIFSQKRSIPQAVARFTTAQQSRRAMESALSELDQNPIRPHELDGNSPKR